MATITLNSDLTLGERLARARTIAGMTQKQLAAVVGRNEVSVSHYETDDVKSPAFEVIVRWAHATGMPLEWFAEAIDDESASISW